jgi:drug/metabolite transporter (DMT)-like permease
MKRDASHNLAGSLWMIAAMAGFAVEDAFLKSAASHVPLGQVLVIMGLSGALAFAALSIAQGQGPFPAELFRRTMILRSAFEIGGRLFYALAVALTPISTASAILQATPLVVVTGAAVIFGERVGAVRWALIGAGFVGVLIILRPGLAGFDALSIFAVLGLIGFAGRDLATRAAAPSLSMAQLGVAGFAVLAASGVILMLWAGQAVWPSALVWAQIAGTTLFGLLGYGALTQAMRTGQVSAVTPFRYTRLLFAMILGVTVFGERPDGATLLGAAVIVGCGSILLGQRRRA